MGELVLIVRIAGQTVAIRAAAVSAVIEIDEIAPVPRSVPHVAGLAALRSRVLTVIDSYAALALARPGEEGREAVVVEVDGHGYALCVDAVDDVLQTDGDIEVAHMPLRGRWAELAAGTVTVGGDTLLLIDVPRLIAGTSNAPASAVAA